MSHGLAVCFLSFLIITFSFEAYAQETSGGFLSGSMRVGYDNGTCDSTIGGAIRYDSSQNDVEFCNETCWLSLSCSACSISSGLIGHWKLDEFSGTNAPDSSTTGGNGTLTNMAVPGVWIAGTIDNALDFDGANDYVDAGSPATFDDIPQFTVSAWINADLNNTVGIIVSKFSPGWLFEVNSSGGLEFWANFNGVTVSNRWSSNGIITLGAGWQHVVVTYDGTSSGTGISLFLDGAEVSYGGSANGTNPRTSDAATNLRIAARSSGGYFNGQMDEVRIYNRILSAAEISRLHSDDRCS